VPQLLEVKPIRADAPGGDPPDGSSEKEIVEMKSLNRAVALTVIAIAALGSVNSSWAASSSYRTYGDLEHGPRWEDQAMDAVLARPIGVVGTGLGMVVWGISLPFSLLGGNAGEAADTLVGGPARETFVRCLGCRSAGRRQHTAATQ
jgi:hypothetical protein